MMKQKVIIYYAFIILSFTSCLFDTALEDFEFPAPNVGILEYQDSTVLLIYPDPTFEEYDIEQFVVYKRLKGGSLKEIASLSSSNIENGILRFSYLSDEITLPTEFGAKAFKSYSNRNVGDLKTNFAYSPSTFWQCSKLDDNTVRIGHVNTLIRVTSVVLEAAEDGGEYNEIREWEKGTNMSGLTYYNIPFSEFSASSISFRIKYRNAFGDSEPTSPITILR